MRTHRKRPGGRRGPRPIHLLSPVTLYLGESPVPALPGLEIHVGDIGDYLDASPAPVPAVAVATEDYLEKGLGKAIRALRSRWMALPVVLVADPCRAVRVFAEVFHCELVGTRSNVRERVGALVLQAHLHRAWQGRRAGELARSWSLTDREDDALLVVTYGAARRHMAQVIGVGEKRCEELLGAVYRASESSGHASLLFRVLRATAPVEQLVGPSLEVAVGDET